MVTVIRYEFIFSLSPQDMKNAEFGTTDLTKPKFAGTHKILNKTG